MVIVVIYVSTGFIGVVARPPHLRTLQQVDRCLAILEYLIIPVAITLVVLMSAVYAYAPPEFLPHLHAACILRRLPWCGALNPNGLRSFRGSDRLLEEGNGRLWRWRSSSWRGIFSSGWECCLRRPSLTAGGWRILFVGP
jgi:hypothetical protein